MIQNKRQTKKCWGAPLKYYARLAAWAYTTIIVLVYPWFLGWVVPTSTPFGNSPEICMSFSDWNRPQKDDNFWNLWTWPIQTVIWLLVSNEYVSHNSGPHILPPLPAHQSGGGHVEAGHLLLQAWPLPPRHHSGKNQYRVDIWVSSTLLWYRKINNLNTPEYS